jgi:hypothetical protein
MPVEGVQLRAPVPEDAAAAAGQGEAGPKTGKSTPNMGVDSPSFPGRAATPRIMAIQSPHPLRDRQSSVGRFHRGLNGSFFGG